MVLRIWLICFAVTALAADNPAGDAQALKGDWVVERAEALKEEVKDAKDRNWVFSGDRINSEILKRNANPESVPYKLDPTKSPKEIDLYEGDKVSSKGIYELDGDKLTLCLGPAHYRGGPAKGDKSVLVRAGDRPTKIDSTLGVVVVLKRAK